VVRLRPSGGSPVEVGRVTIAGGEQSFQFNVSRALGQAAGSSAEIEVAVSTAAAARRRPVQCSRSHARRS
jgi:hypothetical protein